MGSWTRGPLRAKSAQSALALEAAGQSAPQLDSRRAVITAAPGLVVLAVGLGLDGRGWGDRFHPRFMHVVGRCGAQEQRFYADTTSVSDNRGVGEKSRPSGA